MNWNNIWAEVIAGTIIMIISGIVGWFANDITSAKSTEATSAMESVTENDMDNEIIDNGYTDSGESVKDSQYGELTAKIEELQEMNTTLQQEYESMEENYKNAIEENESIQQEYQLTQENYESMKENYENAIEENEKIQQEYQTTQENYENATEENESIQQEYQLTPENNESDVVEISEVQTAKNLFNMETFTGMATWQTWGSGYTRDGDFRDIYENEYLYGCCAAHKTNRSSRDSNPVYFLGGNYTKCRGKIVWSKNQLSNSKRQGEIWIEFYEGDDLIYRTANVVALDEAMEFEFDVTGVETLKMVQNSSYNRETKVIYDYLELIP